MRFEDYWENYGELHASMCGGNIKQFAKEIWMSANVNTDYMVVDGESEHLYVTPKPETTARELLEKVKNAQVDTYHQGESTFAPSAHGFWYSTINLAHLNDGGILVAEGVEYCLAGKKLFCRASEKEPFEACGDMKADDFIKVLILGEHKK
jgi:hypothetical protein